MTNSLWFELEFDKQTKLFELRPQDDRIVVVGSLFRADVRVDRPSVKPVHFEFERVGHDLLVKPAYGADVRLLGEPISEPTPLRGESVLEFAGVEVHVRIVDALPRAFTAAAPPVVTPDPLLTIIRPDDDDDEVEITEVIPPTANRKVEPPRPSPKPEPLELSARGAHSLHCSPAPTALATAAAPAPLRSTPAGAPKLGADHARSGRARPRFATITLVCLLFVVGVLAVIGLLGRCAADTPEGRPPSWPLLSLVH